MIETVATPVHCAEIVAMLRIMREESPNYNYAEDDPSWVVENLKRIVEAGSLTGVIHPGKGFLIGAIAHPWYSRRVEAYEQLLYIHPVYRGGMLAVRLIRAWEALARARGAEVSNVGASSGMAEDRTKELYARLGYTFAGPSLKKDLTHV